MHYRTLGKTGIEVSILGFGALRLPGASKGRARIDVDESIRIIRRAIDSGVNVVDVGYDYGNEKSEIILGRALKGGYRQNVTLMTKNPIWKKGYQSGDYDRFLDEQLARLDVECIDIYLFHNMNRRRYKETVQRLHLFDSMRRAKEKGKIKHIGFSSHDQPTAIRKYIDENDFEIMLVQYNFLDPINERIIQYAHERGMGVILMGPCGGGRLTSEPPEDLKQYLTPGKSNFSDLAFKFVWSNPNVDVALSGMSSDQMVDENTTLASISGHQLNHEERARLQRVAYRYRETYDLNCTQCGYCDGCPEEVNIKLVFKLLLASKIPPRMPTTKANYRRIGRVKRFPGNNALACVECGECLERCPQGIPIIDRLKEAHTILSR